MRWEILLMATLMLLTLTSAVLALWNALSASS